MKARVFSLDGEPLEEIELPPVFDEEIRPDLIARAVLAAQSARIQPWGVDVMAGKRTSAETWGKGHGVARVRRVKGTRYPAAGRGAFVPFTVGGRRAHPPKVEKVLCERINKKERRLAIRSAIAATSRRELVASRGHVVAVPELPFVLSEEIEGKKKSREVREVFKTLGVWRDVERVIGRRKIRAGKGKMRGRRYRRAVGPLLVIGRDSGVKAAARNLPGIDVVMAENLNAELLAPGGMPGRLTVWTKSAIQKLASGVFA